MAADSECCENCCGCCCHGSVNLVALMTYVGGWMISIGIIMCAFGFGALADAKDIDVFKVIAMLMCAVGVPTCLASFYVNSRVLTLMEGDKKYLRTRDALFDVFVVIGSILIILGFIFMIIGFSVQSRSVVLMYFGVIGVIQLVVGMLDLVFIRVWVRGSQPQTGRGNIIDVILDLRYPVYVFENACYEREESQSSPEPQVCEEDLGDPTIVVDALAQRLQYTNGILTTYLPGAPPTYEQAVSTSTEESSNEPTDNVQFEPPPAYQLTA